MVNSHCPLQETHAIVWVFFVTFARKGMAGGGGGGARRPGYGARVRSRFVDFDNSTWSAVRMTGYHYQRVTNTKNPKKPKKTAKNPKKPNNHGLNTHDYHRLIFAR